MTHHNDYLVSISKRLERRLSKPFEVAALAYDLVALINDLSRCKGSKEKLAAGTLLDEFAAATSPQQLSDVIRDCLEYAIRLATSSGMLEYEEIHKLFSLCDEIQALRHLGAHVDESAIRRFEAALRKWLLSEPARSRLVAEDKVEPWKAHWWWYQDQRGGDASQCR